LETTQWQSFLVVTAAIKYPTPRGIVFIAGSRFLAIYRKQKAEKSDYYWGLAFYCFQLYFHGLRCGADIRRQ
jgi:hypothetical protein